ncbi:MAG: fibronectin type III domain-containing protein [Bacteroidaceae bacterium]|nr:fibronectin type III domain-containing protein [Bacteroidaceae bacterium]
MNLLFRKTLTAVALLLSSASMMAQTPVDASAGDDVKTAVDGSGTESDTLANDNYIKPLRFKMHVLARPKGDKVLLRWAPSEFAPWYFANRNGYKILRVDYDNESRIDTLVSDLRPMPLEEMKVKFEASDSLAGAAAQMLYGRGTGVSDAVGESGSDGIMKVYDEQQTRFAYAMLLSEIRPDLAKAMALMYEDNTARKGGNYMYLVTVNVPDSILPVDHFPVDIKNVKQKPEEFKPELKDSIGEFGNSVVLTWPMDRRFSTFDIECRYNGGEWQKLNKRPFLTLITFENEEDAENHYEHKDLKMGKYEYRVCGYDAFGDKSEYSDVLEVELKDIVGPGAPVIRIFKLENQPDGSVYANVYWKKTTFEPDFVGYDVYIHNSMVDSMWVKINENGQLAPTDTVFRFKMPHVSTTLVTVAAVDTVGNYSPSQPQQIHISDLIPPSPPKNLKAVVSPSGNVLITWSPSPEEDTYGYQLFSANHPDDPFIGKSGEVLKDTLAFDTIKVGGTNQRYIYYRVRAFDHSGNESDFSEILRVARKNYKQPNPPRIDSLKVTDDHIYMTWFPSPEADIERYFVYRRVKGEELSTLIKTVAWDSLENNRIVVIDTPEPDTRKRYEYYLESVNTTGIGSNPSQPVSVTFTGSMVLPVQISLNAAYRNEEKRIDFAWDIYGLTDKMITNGAYLCLYRMIEGEEFFRSIESMKPGTLTTYDRRVPAGKTAEYKIRVMSRDGKHSLYSNTVKVTVPEPEKVEEY